MSYVMAIKLYFCWQFFLHILHLNKSVNQSKYALIINIYIFTLRSINFSAICLNDSWFESFLKKEALIVVTFRLQNIIGFPCIVDNMRGRHCSHCYVCGNCEEPVENSFQVFCIVISIHITKTYIHSKYWVLFCVCITVTIAPVYK
jgi:hypothetical protein